MIKKNLTYLLMFGLPIVLCAIFTVLTFNSVQSNNETKESVETYDKLARSKQKSFDKYKAKVDNQAITQATSSTNDLVKAVGVSHEQYFVANDLISNFLKVYLTWNNSKEYQARSKKLSPYITQELADNKTVFDNGKDTTGGNYIKSLQLKSTYLSSKTQTTTEGDGDNLVVLTRVNQKSWYGNDVDKSGNAEGYYKFTINTKDKKISNLEILSSSVSPLKD